MSKTTRKQDAKSAAAAQAKERAKRQAGRALKVDPATRRQAILDAALTVFAERGFETARLDDVAARAGVAKGTLYLYFKDKETLFEEVVRSAISPILERLDGLAAAPDVPFDDSARSPVRDVREGGAGHAAQAPHPPHHRRGAALPAHCRVLLSQRRRRIMPLIAQAGRARGARGEIATDAVARYPQLVAAPLLMAVIWDALFSKLKPLDVAGLLRAHRELLTGKPRRTSP